MKFYLIVAKGSKQGLPIEVKVDLFLIGSDKECQLRKRSLQPKQCAFVTRSKKVFVRDMDSTLAKVKAFPEAKIMNVSGGPTDPSLRPDRSPWLVVKVPGSSTYVQLVGVAAGRVG